MSHHKEVLRSKNGGNRINDATNTPEPNEESDVDSKCSFESVYPYITAGVGYKDLPIDACYGTKDNWSYFNANDLPLNLSIKSSSGQSQSTVLSEISAYVDTEEKPKIIYEEHPLQRTKTFSDSNKNTDDSPQNVSDKSIDVFSISMSCDGVNKESVDQIIETSRELSQVHNHPSVKHLSDNGKTSESQQIEVTKPIIEVAKKPIIVSANNFTKIPMAGEYLDSLHCASTPSFDVQSISMSIFEPQNLTAASTTELEDWIEFNPKVNVVLPLRASSTNAPFHEAEFNNESLDSPYSYPNEKTNVNKRMADQGQFIDQPQHASCTSVDLTNEDISSTSLTDEIHNVNMHLTDRMRSVIHEDKQSIDNKTVGAIKKKDSISTTIVKSERSSTDPHIQGSPSTSNSLGKKSTQHESVFSKLNLFKSLSRTKHAERICEACGTNECNSCAGSSSARPACSQANPNRPYSCPASEQNNINETMNYARVNNWSPFAKVVRQKNYIFPPPPEVLFIESRLPKYETSYDEVDDDITDLNVSNVEVRPAESVQLERPGRLRRVFNKMTRRLTRQSPSQNSSEK